MKTIQDLYPEYWKEEQDFGSFYGPSDCQPMINEIGNVLIQVDDADYQGDSRVLFQKEGRYGYLIFGWGSCSGCDSLQACSSMKDIQEVFEGMVNDTKWFVSLGELKQYFEQKDWELDYAWHSEETRRFISSVIEYENK